MTTSEEVTRTTRNLTWFTLATSTSTLLCCALPALFVALGAGAALASVVSAIPQLVWISEYKNAVFGIAGVLLAAAGGMHWHANTLPCPIDPDLGRQCNRSRTISLLVYLVSVAIFVIGGFFAYIAPDIF